MQYILIDPLSDFIPHPKAIQAVKGHQGGNLGTLVVHFYGH